MAVNIKDAEFASKVLHSAINNVHKELSATSDKQALQSLKNVTRGLDENITGVRDGLGGVENGIYNSIKNIESDERQAEATAKREREATERAVKKANEALAAQTEANKLKEAEGMVKAALLSGKSEKDMVADLKAAADRAGYKPGSTEMEQLLGKVIRNLSSQDLSGLNLTQLRTLRELGRDNGAFEKTFDHGISFEPRHDLKRVLDREIKLRKAA